MAVAERAVIQQTIVLIGLESVGKTALFRNLTGEASGDENNFRGSTVQVRSAKFVDRTYQLIDTPGIRLREDSLTTTIALQAVDEADTIVLVIRGTHAKQEIKSLRQALGQALQGCKVALAITFEDKAATELHHLANHLEEAFGTPTALVNARAMTSAQYDDLLTTIENAAPLDALPQPLSRAPDGRLDEAENEGFILLQDIPVTQPQTTLFEDPIVGPWLSLLAMALIFASPIYLAYLFAESMQPLVDRGIILPIVNALAPVETMSPLLHAILVGDYGLLTLGWYSFLWAFPVVLLISISVAITEEMGLKDRITTALDPWLRIIGLNGRDLIPILSGFGCNVVAVFQARSCSSCTRKTCISMIAFGSACSYQIGASLSIFNSAHRPWLFIPYLLVLFIVSAIYTRIWAGNLDELATLPFSERAFLQKPTLKGIWWRVKSVLKQFLEQAMPIFLIICAVGAILEYLGILQRSAALIAPLVNIFGLPAEAAPGIIFSIIRKDGLLILNQGQGALIEQMSAGQVFILVYLASTLTACLVTLWAIRSELGWGYALTLAGRQALTSVLSTLLLATLTSWLY